MPWMQNGQFGQHAEIMEDFTIAVSFILQFGSVLA